MKQPADFIEIASFPQAVDLPIVEALLDEADVRYFMQNENLVAVNPLLSGAVGGIRLLVASSDAARAREVVDDYQRRCGERRNAARQTCPECGCEDGQRIRRPTVVSVAVALLLVLTLGVLALLFPWSAYRCPECGCRWR